MGGDAIQTFDGFALDRANRLLTREGKPVELGSRYLDALMLLLETPGALVTKDRFMEEVWRGIPVTDEALTQCIRTLRRALGERAGEARFIETVPKHGYRFVAEVGAPSPAVRANSEGTGPTRPSPSSLGGRVAGAATLGGTIAGALGGGFYGSVATNGGASPALVLVVLVAALGLLGGAGVGLGIGAAVAWRGRTASSLIGGGMLGGGIVGALGSILGQDGIAALTGVSLPQMTGLFEGIVLGLAVGANAAVTLRGDRGARATIALAAALGALAGVVIALAGGALLGRSLMFLAIQFPASQIAMDQLGWLVADNGFGRRAQLVTSALEAAAFAVCIAVALRRIR